MWINNWDVSTGSDTHSIWPVSPQNRTIWWITTQVLDDAETLMSMSISYNYEYSFLDEDNMIVYLCFKKNWKYYRAVSRYSNISNPNGNNPQDLFTIKTNDIEVDTEVEWVDISVSLDSFDKEDIPVISNAMKSFIFMKTIKH